MTDTDGISSSSGANDNFPAFPTCTLHDHGAMTWSGGMTLRDWFAGMVLSNTAYITTATPKTTETFHEDGIAFNAYRIADAMLKARKCEQKGGTA